MGRVEKDLNTLNPLCLKCVLSIPFSILYTVKLLRNVKAEEFLITNDKIKSSFFCSDLKQKKLTAVFLICH